MQGTISIGDSINVLIVDTQAIINDLSETIDFINILIKLYENNELYIGTAYDQIKKFTDNLYMQIYKMLSFYELGIKYMEDARDKLDIADKKSLNIVEAMGEGLTLVGR